MADATFSWILRYIKLYYMFTMIKSTNALNLNDTLFAKYCSNCLRRDVAAAPQTPQLGGAQANFGGPS